jgi:hypothetical protein
MSRHRMKRRGIFKVISGTRAYECDDCSQNYVWFKFVNMSLKIKY